MATDKDRGLPIRTEDDSDNYVRSKIFDESNSANGATVDTDKNLHVEMHGNRCDDAADVVAQLSEEGRVNGRGDYQVDDNSCPATVGLIAHVRNATHDDTFLTNRITSVVDPGNSAVISLDVSIRDSDGKKIDADNPLAVTLEESNATEVQDFDGTVDINAGATANHDYSIADGDVFLLDEVLSRSTLRHKIEIQVGDGAVSETFTTIAIALGTEADQDSDTPFKAPVKVIGTVNTTTIRLIKENRDDVDPVCVYTTIVGRLRTL